MTVDDKIKDEKIQYDINREAAKISALSSGKIDKYGYVTGEEILPSDQSKIIEQAKFTYSPLGKAFEKQINTIEDQGENQIKALEEDGEQPVKHSDEKESLTYSKQKKNWRTCHIRVEETQNLSKQIDFNNFFYYYKGKNAPFL